MALKEIKNFSMSLPPIRATEIVECVCKYIYIYICMYIYIYKVVVLNTYLQMRFEIYININWTLYGSESFCDYLIYIDILIKPGDSTQAHLYKYKTMYKVKYRYILQWSPRQ